MITSIEKRLLRQHRASEVSKRVATIPGIAVIGATAITRERGGSRAYGSRLDFYRFDRSVVENGSDDFRRNAI
jgi:transposase